MTTERDIKNQIDFARDKGREEGREEGRAENNLAVAKKLKELDTPWDVIAQATGLTLEQIEAL